MSGLDIVWRVLDGEPDHRRQPTADRLCLRLGFVVSGHAAIPALMDEELEHIGSGDLDLSFSVAAENVFKSKATACSVFGWASRCISP